VIGRVIAGVPVKVSVELSTENDELGSLVVVSVIPSGLNINILEAVVGQLPRFVVKSPLEYAEVVPLNNPSIVVAAVGVHADRPAAVNELALANM
jgi:hypothetical protein